MKTRSVTSTLKTKSRYLAIISGASDERNGAGQGPKYMHLGGTNLMIQISQSKHAKNTTTYRDTEVKIQPKLVR